MTASSANDSFMQEIKSSLDMFLKINTQTMKLFQMQRWKLVGVEVMITKCCVAWKIKFTWLFSKASYTVHRDLGLCETGQ